MMKFVLSVIVLSTLSACVTPGSKSAEDLSKCKTGWQETSQGRHELAVDLFLECIETGKLSKPNLARTHRNIGIAYNRMGVYGIALTYFDLAILTGATDHYADYVNRGNAWSGLQDYGKALADYRTALHLKPNDGATIFNRGIVYEKMGKTDLAVQDFLRATGAGYGSIELLSAMARHKEYIRLNKERLKLLLKQ
jgi:tetratricopeptide (TPR) repeat protein